ncbi:TPA: hypothetical protein ACKP7D_001006 [Serratia marcescens]
MINSINSVKLRSILPNKTHIEFDRENVSSGDADVKLTIQADFSDKKSTEDKLCKLTLSATAEAVNDKDVTFAELTFTVDYIFDIVDKESYGKLSDDEKTCICSNLAYMDYRRKLLTAMSTVAMSSIKLPLSLQDLMS